jgi:hypothetical protein
MGRASVIMSHGSIDAILIDPRSKITKTNLWRCTFHRTQVLNEPMIIKWTLFAKTQRSDVDILDGNSNSMYHVLPKDATLRWHFNKKNFKLKLTVYFGPLHPNERKWKHVFSNMHINNPVSNWYNKDCRQFINIKQPYTWLSPCSAKLNSITQIAVIKVPLVSKYHHPIVSFRANHTANTLGCLPLTFTRFQ